MSVVDDQDHRPEALKLPEQVNQLGPRYQRIDRPVPGTLPRLVTETPANRCAQLFEYAEGECRFGLLATDAKHASLARFLEKLLDESGFANPGGAFDDGDPCGARLRACVQGEEVINFRSPPDKGWSVNAVRDRRVATVNHLATPAWSRYARRIPPLVNAAFQRANPGESLAPKPIALPELARSLGGSKSEA